MLFVAPVPAQPCSVLPMSNVRSTDAGPYHDDTYPFVVMLLLGLVLVIRPLLRVCCLLTPPVRVATTDTILSLTRSPISRVSKWHLFYTSALGSSTHGYISSYLASSHRTSEATKRRWASGMLSPSHRKQRIRWGSRV
jgi:hypothetical protein